MQRYSSKLQQLTLQVEHLTCPTLDGMIYLCNYDPWKYNDEDYLTQNDGINMQIWRGTNQEKCIPSYS